MDDGSGQESELATQFAAHRDRLRRIVNVRIDDRLRGRVDPSDVMQEVFLDARQRYEHFQKKPEMPFFVWLRELVTQRLIELHRKHVQAQMRSVENEVAIADTRRASQLSVQQIAGSNTSPSHAFDRRERSDRLRAALSQMNPIDSEVILLRHFEELTNDEVAAVLNLSKAAASNRYIRALGRLKDLLGDDSIDSE